MGSRLSGVGERRGCASVVSLSTAGASTADQPKPGSHREATPNVATWLTTGDVARLLEVPSTAVRDLIRNGELPAVQSQSREWYVEPRVVRAYVIHGCAAGATEIADMIRRNATALYEAAGLLEAQAKAGR